MNPENMDYEPETFPIYESACIYEMEDTVTSTASSDCENLYALPV